MGKGLRFLLVVSIFNSSRSNPELGTDDDQHRTVVIGIDLIPLRHFVSVLVHFPCDFRWATVELIAFVPNINSSPEEDELIGEVDDLMCDPGRGAPVELAIDFSASSFHGNTFE